MQDMVINNDGKFITIEEDPARKFLIKCSEIVEIAIGRTSCDTQYRVSIALRGGHCHNFNTATFEDLEKAWEILTNNLERE
jgi:hypothetical protein